MARLTKRSINIVKKSINRKKQRQRSKRTSHLGCGSRRSKKIRKRNHVGVLRGGQGCALRQTGGTSCHTATTKVGGSRNFRKRQTGGTSCHTATTKVGGSRKYRKRHSMGPAPKVPLFW